MGGEPQGSSNRPATQVASQGGQSARRESQTQRPRAAPGTAPGPSSTPRSTRTAEGSRTSSRSKKQCTHCEKCRNGNGTWESSWKWTDNIKISGRGMEGFERLNKKIDAIILGPGLSSTSWTSSSRSSCPLCESGKEGCSDCKKGRSGREVSGRGGTRPGLPPGYSEAKKHFEQVIAQALAGRRRGHRMEVSVASRERGENSERPSARPVVMINDEEADGRTKTSDATSQRKAEG